MSKLYCLVFILYALLLSLGSDGGFPTEVNHGNFFPYIIDKPFTEDGFYMMTVAWNIAEGKGITYNLNRPTTGIQPVVTYIQAGIAKAVIIFGGDKIDFLRVMIIFSSILIFIFSIAAGNVVNRIVPGFYNPAVMVFLVLFCFELFDIFNNGLETGFYLLMIALCINYSFHFVKNSDYKSSIVFGCLAGLTALTRVDFVLPFFVYILFISLARKINPLKLILVLLITGGFLIPWLAYVYNVSGEIFPSSVSVHTSFFTLSTISERFYYILRAMFSHLTPFLFTYNFLISAATAIFYGIVFYYLLKKTDFLKTIDKPGLLNLNGWGISFFILGTAYFVYSPTQHFYIRYTTPFYLYIFLIAVCCIFYILHKAPALFRKIFFAIIVLLFFSQAYYYTFNRKLSNPLTIRIAYINNHINEPGLIGLFQSGVTGFFVNNVVNLDGKVDHVAHHYGVRGKLNDFLDSMHVNVIIELKEDFNVPVDDNYFKSNWRLYDNDIGDGITQCFLRGKQKE